MVLLTNKSLCSGCMRKSECSRYEKVERLERLAHEFIGKENGTVLRLHMEKCLEFVGEEHG